MSRLVVHTARLSYGGPDRLDVTRKGAEEHQQRHGTPAPGEPFAPPRWLLNVALALGRGDAPRVPAGVPAPPAGDVAACGRWYVARYTEAMRASYRARRDAWDALLARDRVVVVCFCGHADACHRGTLAAILAKLGAANAGELPPAAQRRQPRRDAASS